MIPRRLRTLLRPSALLLLLGCASLHRSAPERVDPHEQTRRLGRGVNILGYDPIWRDPAQARFTERHFAVIREGGFQTVRLNLHAFQHMDARNQLDTAWLRRLDWAVDRALANHLMVILDLHNFEELSRDTTGFGDRYRAFWRQVSARYAGAPSAVLFELLNEPNSKLTAELWNRYLAEGLAIVRRTNPTRTVIVGPASWNSMFALDSLRLPDGDRNLIVTVHYYSPFPFTHQGASWAGLTGKTGVTWGTEAEQRAVDADFARAQAWATEHDRPIFLGEFGAYDQGEMPSRARWTAHVARAAERLGWAWAYWQFDSDFIAYDIARDAWVEPIHRALVP